MTAGSVDRVDTAGWGVEPSLYHQPRCPADVWGYQVESGTVCVVRRREEEEEEEV